MLACSFPKRIVDPEEGFFLEAYSPLNQQELWQSILSDREHPKRKGVWPRIQSFEAMSSYMNACDLDNPASEEYGYLIRSERGVLLGTFHVFSVNWAQATAEAGYALHHRFVGQGIATKALLLMERCLQTMGFKLIIISCNEWNEKSWAVAERAGYRLDKKIHEDRECPGCDDCSRIYKKEIKRIKNI